MLARLRQKDAALLVETGVVGDRAWPRPQRRLTVSDNRWSGLGRGHGHLQGRRVTVRPRGGGVPDRTVDLWLPDQRLDVRVETDLHQTGYGPAGSAAERYAAYGDEVAAG